MKFIYIKLSEDLTEALYQLISASLISEYQEGILTIDPLSKFKNNIFKNYNFNKVSCRNLYIEKIHGNYNCFTTKCYKYNLELVGEFKNIDFFINHVDEFLKTLYFDGYDNEINLWLEQINNYKKNITNKNIYSLNLYSNKYMNSVEHRGGWKDIIKNLFDNKLLKIDYSNYYLIDIVDHYIYNDDLIIKKEWFGFIHSTCNVPEFININKISDIIKSIFFKKNSNNCLGLITFTNNIKSILDNYNLGINILFVKLPINNIDIELFNINNFISNKNKIILLLGKQLRKLSTIYLLNTYYKKCWLPGTKKYINISMNNLNNELIYLCKNIDEINFNSVEIKYFDSYKDYDNFLINNIIIIDLWDVNANNSIIECIIRNIPFFVKKLIEVIEYLGSDYPMYFNSIEQLENMINNSDLNILYQKTNNYLINIDKNDLTYNHFNYELNIFFKKNINKMKILFSNIKEHNNWSIIEKYLEDKFSNICLSEKILFIPFVDIFILDKAKLSFNFYENFYENFNWIGILHNPDLSNVYPENDIFVKKIFLNYLNNCKGLFVMSIELKNLIINKFNPSFFVEVIYHPLPYINVLEWNYEMYKNNNDKKIIQVGNWLRKTYAIFKINIPKNFTKVITPFNDRTKNELTLWCKKENIDISQIEFNQVIKYTFIENNEYNKLFESNIFFLDLYDSTANNIILECIKSNCPIIINSNPNIKNYLGNDYPLYYNDYDQINELLNDNNILKANIYLKNLNKTKFDNEYLFNNIFDILKNNNFIIK